MVLSQGLISQFMNFFCPQLRIMESIHNTRVANNGRVCLRCPLCYRHAYVPRRMRHESVARANNKTNSHKGSRSAGNPELIMVY